jgi:hypothetical protein
MDGTFRTSGRQEMLKNIWSENLKGRDHLGRLGVDMILILKYRIMALGCGLD